MADARTQRALEVMDSIRQVLFQEWDPIGVNDNERVSDEYDSCIAPVYRLLAEGASAQAIAECLFKLEHDLGVPGKSRDHLLLVANRLRALNVKLGSDAA
jgi:hypothetical protein